MSAEVDHEKTEIPDEDLDLLAYLDGELEGEQLVAFEARLRSDRALASRLRALEAVGQFLRGDADRIYRDAKVDSIVDDVFAKLREEPKPERHLRAVEERDIAPPTSRLARSRRGTVVWVVFGGIAAAAAGVLFFMSAHEKGGPAPVASTPSPKSSEIVAKAPIPQPTIEPKVSPPVPETASTVEVEGLEVG
ncbi:MAG: anti-sigma factor family protein, partial [Polyangiales bacterium]